MKNRSIRRIISLSLSMILMSGLAINASALTPAPTLVDPPRPVLDSKTDSSGSDVTSESSGSESAPGGSQGNVSDSACGIIEDICTRPPVQVADEPTEGSGPATAPTRSSTSADFMTESDKTESISTDSIPETVEGACTLTPGGILEETVSDPYMYWVAAVMGDIPVIKLNPNTGEKYLAFQLANISRLEYFYNTYRDAFQLENHLRNVEELTRDQNAIWKKGSWSLSIGEQLSESAQAHIKANPMNSLEAMQYIKGLPEYLHNDQLRKQIDYRLACFEYEIKDIEKGVEMLRTDVRIVPASGSCDGAEYTRHVRHFLDQHPELNCLDEVVTTYHSMPSSKFVTMQNLGQERVDELYAKVEAVAKVYWPGTLMVLDRYNFVIPMPQGVEPSWFNSK